MRVRHSCCPSKKCIPLSLVSFLISLPREGELMDNESLIYLHCLITKSGRRIYFQGHPEDEGLLPLLVKFSTESIAPKVEDFIVWATSHSKLKPYKREGRSADGEVHEEEHPWPFDE